MPRVKPLIREDPRETEIRREIGGIMGELRLTQGQLAERAGIDKATFSRRLKDLGSMRLSEYWRIQDAAKLKRWGL